jgi:competence protein ComGC
MLNPPLAHELHQTTMTLRFSHQRNQALTRTEAIVVIATLAVLFALLLPALVTVGHDGRQRISCVNDLKQVGIAFRLWEGDHNGKYPMAVSVTNGGALELIAMGNVAVCFQVMSNEVNTPKILLCPADTHRVWTANFSTLNNSNISYFVNPDAVEAYPQMVLDGDDNLTVGGVRVRPGILNLWTNATMGWTKERHHGGGNIGLADGSVQQITSDGLNSLVAGGGTNRLVIP